MIDVNQKISEFTKGIINEHLGNVTYVSVDKKGNKVYHYKNGDEDKVTINAKKKVVKYKWLYKLIRKAINKLQRLADNNIFY